MPTTDCPYGRGRSASDRYATHRLRPRSSGEFSESSPPRTGNRVADAEAKRKADEVARKKAEAERFAKSILKYARELIDAGMTEKARERLKEVVKRYPDTDAADDAKVLLDKLGR